MKLNSIVRLHIAAFIVVIVQALLIIEVGDMTFYVHGVNNTKYPA